MKGKENEIQDIKIRKRDKRHKKTENYIQERKKKVSDMKESRNRYSRKKRRKQNLRKK